MKKIRISIIIAFFFYHPVISLAQTLNWANFKRDQAIININAGVEHGLILGLGCGYQLKSKLPIILDAEYSFPMGGTLFDDFKTKIGGQLRCYQTGNIQCSIRFQGLFRRYGSDFVRLLNFGSDMSVTAGYYKSKWFVAGEFGFDKAIITHFKHTEEYKAIYSMVKDGWYEPGTGGNFYYVLQTGHSFKKMDLYLKAGKVITQDFKLSPVIPLAVQLGFNLKINCQNKG